MGIFEGKIFERKRKEHLEEEKAAPAPEKTVPEILRDPHLSELFGRYLENEGISKEEKQQIFKGEFTDFQRLNKWQLKFLDRIKNAEEIKEYLNENFIKELTIPSQDFRSLVDLAGADRVLELLKRQLDFIAIQEPDRLNKIRDQLKRIKSQQESARQREEEIRSILQERGITEEELLENLDNTEGLRRLVRSKLSLLERIFKGEKFVEQYVQKLNIKSEVEQYITEIKEAQREIGELLAGFLTNNTEAKSILAQTIIGERIPPKEAPGSGFQAARELMVPEEELKEELNREYDNWWQDLEDTSQYTNKDDQRAKRAFFDDWKKKKIGDRRGFWVNILLEHFIDSLGKEILGI